MKETPVKKPMFFWLIFIFLSFLFAFGIYLLTASDTQYFQQRAETMNRCVELKIYSNLSNEKETPPQYELRFEDEFFCPTRSYTVLEVLQRAESVFNIKKKPLNIILKDIPNGVILESMAGRTNSVGMRWRVAVGGNQEDDRPLDKIVLQGKSYINFYYK